MYSYNNIRTLSGDRGLIIVDESNRKIIKKKTIAIS